MCSTEKGPVESHWGNKGQKDLLDEEIKKLGERQTQLFFQIHQTVIKLYSESMDLGHDGTFLSSHHGRVDSHKHQSILPKRDALLPWRYSVSVTSQWEVSGHCFVSMWGAAWCV